jgi:hypothetical protein
MRLVQNQMSHLLKNAITASGLLPIAAVGSGALSFDNQCESGQPNRRPAVTA